MAPPLFHRCSKRERGAWEELTPYSPQGEETLYTPFLPGTRHAEPALLHKQLTVLAGRSDQFGCSALSKLKMFTTLTQTENELRSTPMKKNQTKKQNLTNLFWSYCT